MDGVKELPRMLSIKQIQSHYIKDIGYKKLKCFLLNYVPHKKIGNTYYLKILIRAVSKVQECSFHKETLKN